MEVKIDTYLKPFPIGATTAGCRRAPNTVTMSLGVAVYACSGRDPVSVALNMAGEARLEDFSTTKMVSLILTRIPYARSSTHSPLKPCMPR